MGMHIGCILGVAFLALVLYALATHGKRRTYAMTKRLPLPYAAGHSVDDAQASLRRCSALLEDLRNTGRLSVEEREKLATAAWYATEARLSLAEVKKQ
jgi:hypothetical protein